MIPETTERMDVEMTRLSIAGDAFGKPMSARHGEPGYRRLQAVG
ncbi:hypothetical protein OHA40_01915 [Nocardia sp. NBC_00508]|nr:hypothetical protein [Nocardia sp. NBC_00508]WUD66950.1 hypothetical protein OHA40_01915 [Nocardia sp. NBC_00508]